MSETIARLAAALGVQPGYHEFSGHWVETTPETALALIGALLGEVETEAQAARALAAWEAEEANRLAPREIVAQCGYGYELRLARAASWRLMDETGAEIAEGLATREIVLPALPLGVNRLALTEGAAEQTVWLIAAPAQPPGLRALTGMARAWGVTAPLYGLRSARNAGIGDYRDLGAMAAAVGGLGASFLGVNPLHAHGVAESEEMISPYSPTHRGFLTHRHIALDDLARFGGADWAGARCAEGDLVDHAAIAELREPALEAGFTAFEALPEDAAPRRAFAAFRVERGRALEQFARFEALSLIHGGDWRRWPAELQDPDSAACAAFAEGAPREIRRHVWRQWVADGQLEQAARAARAGGARLGLYLDLAVGARPGGAESWGAGRPLGASIGAPPDGLSDKAQGWGLTPLNPIALRETGYAKFSGLLRGAIRHAGMLRIDHALGLTRAYWAPDCGGPGAYVSFNEAAMLAVARIEAARAQALLVGEDLGLAPEGYRDRMSQAGLYGLDIMQFERNGDGSLRDTSGFRAHALAAFATHDTPTIAGFYAAHDVELRHELGRISREERDWLAGERAALAAGRDKTTQIDDAHRALAKAASELVAVQFDDMAGAVEQQNMPGTVDEHPNWRRRCAITVEAAPTHPALRATADIMRAQGRAGGADD